MISFCHRCSVPTSMHPWRGGIILCSDCLTVVAKDYAKYRRIIGRYLGLDGAEDVDSTEVEVAP